MLKFYQKASLLKTVVLRVISSLLAYVRSNMVSKYFIACAGKR